MKKPLLFKLVMIFLSCAVLAGCSGEIKTSSKLTTDEIKQRYAGSEIKDIRSINTEYVLVESQKNTFANKFDLYDLKTGQVDTLPTMPEFVTLERIENENYFVFLASGKNSESPFGTFPYFIRCFRIKDAAGQDNNFIAVREDKFFGLEESVQAGSKAEGVMSELITTFDGLEILFMPVKGKETGFYADATDIPPTRTSYDKAKKQLTFEVGSSHLAEKLQGNPSTEVENNGYISSYEIIQKGDKINLVVSLKDTAGRYKAEKVRLPYGSMPDGFPILKVEFSGNE